MSSPEALLPLSWSQSLIEHRHNAMAGLFLQDAGYVDSWTPISLAEILLAVCCSLRLCPPSSLPSLCPSPGQTCAGVWWLPLPDRIPPLFLLQTFPQQFFYTSSPILASTSYRTRSNTCDCTQATSSKESSPTQQLVSTFLLQVQKRVVDQWIQEESVGAGGAGPTWWG